MLCDNSLQTFEWRVHMVAPGGLFIVFEGGEGSGKTTQAKLLRDHLLGIGRRVYLTKEPGGDEGVCREIRAILLNAKYKDRFSHRAELLLFEADRAQHAEHVVKPALEDGKIVISDRYEAATYAYQCAGRRLCSRQKFEQFNAFATDDLIPDFTLWIDIDPRVGLERNKLGGKRDRLELEDVEFHERVRHGYEIYFTNVLENDPRQQGRWAKLDGAMDSEALHKEIVRVLNEKRLI